MYRGHDAVEKFIEHLIKWKDKILRVLRDSKPTELPEEDTKVSQRATECHIYHKEL